MATSTGTRCRCPWSRYPVHGEKGAVLVAVLFANGQGAVRISDGIKRRRSGSVVRGLRAPAYVSGTCGMVENAAGQWHRSAQYRLVQPLGTCVTTFRFTNATILGPPRWRRRLRARPGNRRNLCPGPGHAHTADQQHERSADRGQRRQRPNRLGQRSTGHLSPNDGRRYDVARSAGTWGRFAPVPRRARGRREHSVSAEHRQRQSVPYLQDDGRRRDLDASVHEPRLRRVLRLHGLLGRPARPGHRRRARRRYRDPPHRRRRCDLVAHSGVESAACAT